ncbi:MAG: toll/interleukin-1 receptor domain-containing protein [Saprospiraceae bacterium]|nr:toll/interleukin-1 receptor domain-containing protein [Saprospiraceae bacterium]
MTKQEIIDLLLEGEIGQAIKAMRAAMPNDNVILNLAGQWNRLQKDIAARVISPDYASLTQNQIMNNLLELAKKLLDSSASGGGGVANSGGKSPTVFLSYNHKDVSAATQVKDFLRSRGIQVTIDSEAMKPGEDIAAFINKCIREADVTLSLVSSNSLLSAWVGMETINTLVGEHIANKKFIAVVIESAFYEISFVRTSIETINKRLAQLKEELKFRIENDLGFEDLQNERTRNNDLKNDLPKIVANLKNRLNVDIIGPNFDSGMDMVTKAIVGG